MNKPNLIFHFGIHLLAHNDSLVLWLDVIIIDEKVTYDSEFLDMTRSEIIEYLTGHDHSCVQFNYFTNKTNRKASINKIDFIWNSFEFKRQLLEEIKQ